MSTQYPSHKSAYTRFDSDNISSGYPENFKPGKRRHMRELAHIQQAFRYIKPGSRVLDLPCGSGRLTVMLADFCSKVVAADIASGMVERAEQQFAGRECQAELEFQVRDVLDTGYEADSFDAVVSYRLFHHFRESELRQNALTELRRICTGPIVVSVFTSTALDYYVMLFKHLFRRNKPLHRSYIPLSAFEADVDAAGLKIVAKLSRVRFVSPVWIYVLERK